VARLLPSSAHDPLRFWALAQADPAYLSAIAAAQCEHSPLLVTRRRRRYQAAVAKLWRALAMCRGTLYSRPRHRLRVVGLSSYQSSFTLSIVNYPDTSAFPALPCVSVCLDPSFDRGVLFRQGLWIADSRTPPGQECSNGSMLCVAVVL
jgi:hypothetical protein